MLVLEDLIEINASPEKVYSFFIDPEKTYLSWHKDHVKFKWIKGNQMSTGAIGYFEEYLHGKLHKLRVYYSNVIPNKLIEFKPLPRFWRIFYPKRTLEFISTNNGCVFKGLTYFRIGWISSNSKRAKEHIKLIQQHMKDEGENLKHLMESNLRS